MRVRPCSPEIAVQRPNAIAMSRDDFPIYDRNSEIAAQAEAAFEQAVAEAGHFIIQGRDRRDYGTDFQLEARRSDGITNFCASS